MNTNRLVVDRLRGMDQRYYTRAASAAIIEEMTWASYDGWKNAGGYDLITQDLFDWGRTYIPNANNDEEGLRITSIHNFSKGPSFNEIIFEANN